MKHSFTRYAAAFLRWARGRYEVRLTGAFALMADCAADGVRQGARWLLPLVDTPEDALRYQLRHFGLPTYIEGYFETLVRLRDYLPTLEVSGSVDMLKAEALRVGLTNPTVIAEGGENYVIGFSIYADNVGAMVTYGTAFQWGGFQYGHQIDGDSRRNLRAMLRYFRPAREFFTGVFPSP